MPGNLLDSAEAAIIQSCPKHSLNEICAAAAFNAFSAVLFACLMESGIVLITGIGKEPKAHPRFRSAKIHLSWSAQKRRRVDICFAASLFRHEILYLVSHLSRIETPEKTRAAMQYSPSPNRATTAGFQHLAATALTGADRHQPAPAWHGTLVLGLPRVARPDKTRVVVLSCPAMQWQPTCLGLTSALQKQICKGSDAVAGSWALGLASSSCFLCRASRGDSSQDCCQAVSSTSSLLSGSHSKH